MLQLNRPAPFLAPRREAQLEADLLKQAHILVLAEVRLGQHSALAPLGTPPPKAYEHRPALLQPRN